MTRNSLVLSGVMLLLVGALAIWATRPASPVATTPIASASAPASVSPAGVPTPTPTAASAPGTFENPILGYRIRLPEPFRRFASSIVTGQPEILGGDTYTVLTVEDERAECLRDSGDIPSRATVDAYFHVEAHRNVRGVSAVEWARASPRSTHHTVEPDTIDGRETARLVQQGMTTTYVISANDRMYVLALGTWPSQHRIAEIAASFRAIQPLPFPTPTPPPSQAPRDAPRELGQRLAQAFAARDANAVAGLMPQCKIGVTPIIGSVPQGSALNRSVSLFVPALRERFAKGDLTVTVDPEVQVQVQGGTEQFFVRSDWREPDRTTRIDLFLSERDGQWQWTLAVHRYPSLVGNNCIPYRSPWVPTNSSC